MPKSVKNWRVDSCSEKGIVIVSWIWQAGGVASRGKPIVNPEDAKGMKVRGGSREMDLILQEAGAAVVTLPSNEIYAAMQNRRDGCGDDVIDLLHFISDSKKWRRALTTGRDKAYWYHVRAADDVQAAVFDQA